MQGYEALGFTSKVERLLRNQLQQHLLAAREGMPSAPAQEEPPEDQARVRSEVSFGMFLVYWSLFYLVLACVMCGRQEKQAEEELL